MLGILCLCYELEKLKALLLASRTTTCTRTPVVFTGGLYHDGTAPRIARRRSFSMAGDYRE